MKLFNFTFQNQRLKQKFYSFLRWSEQYTKTDMVYLTKGGSWVGIKQGVGIVTGLALSVALANFLPQDVFGNYKFLITLGGIIGAFSLTGMNKAVTQAVARGYEGAVKEGVRENLRWSLGMVFLSLAGAGYYFFNDNSLLGTGLVIIALTLPLINSFNLYLPFLTGRKEFKKSTFYSLPRLLIPPLSLITTLFLTKNPVTLVLVYFTSQAVTITVMYYVTLFVHKLNDRTDSQTINFSKHLSVMNVLQKVSEGLDKILLFHFLGAAPLAVYAFAIAPIREIGKMKTFFLGPAFPKLSQRNISELKKSLPYRMGLLFLFIVPITGLYILTAPFVYELLFPRYIESVIFSQVFAFSLLFMPIPILIEALTAHIKKQELYIIKVATPIARIILLLVLLPFYGIWGAIAALLGTKIVQSLLVFWLFKRTA